MKKLDKRDRALLFRHRLSEAMAANEMSQSKLARSISVDRSTVSQLLTGEGARLPNGQIVGECASALGVSADWLLGLSERPESAADLMAANLSLTEAPRALIDEKIFAWHQEAIGYKIRHVPAGLPDLLKTRRVLEWEFAPHLGRTTEQAIGASQDRLEFLLSSRSDFEIALPQHELESFAKAEGYYCGLSRDMRKEQFERLLELYERLYPTLRIHVFDARRVYSSPLTVFGPLLAVLYVGQHYVAFKDIERVQTFSRNFDSLVKEAEIADRDFPSYISSLETFVG